MEEEEEEEDGALVNATGVTYIQYVCVCELVSVCMCAMQGCH